MKRFEAGKTYKVNGGGRITVTKRTPQYITFEGDFKGKKKIHAYDENGLFGLGENIIVPICKGFSTFCFAEKEVE